MIIVTNAQLGSKEFQMVASKLCGYQCHGDLAAKIMGIAKELNKLSNSVGDKFNKEIFSKYEKCIDKNNGAWVGTEEEKQSFSKEKEEFGKAEHTINLKKLRLDQLKDLKVSALELDMLAPILELPAPELALVKS